MLFYTSLTDFHCFFGYNKHDASDNTVMACDVRLLLQNLISSAPGGAFLDLLIRFKIDISNIAILPPFIILESFLMRFKAKMRKR